MSYSYSVHPKKHSVSLSAGLSSSVPSDELREELFRKVPAGSTWHLRFGMG